MVWTLIAFGITLFVLSKRYAFGPIQKAIDARRDRIRQAARRGRPGPRRGAPAARGAPRARSARRAARRRRSSPRRREVADAQRERVREETEADRQRRLEETKRQIEAETRRALEQIRARGRRAHAASPTSRVTGKVLDRRRPAPADRERRQRPRLLGARRLTATDGRSAQRIYARALFDAAKERAELEAVREELADFVQTLEDVPELDAVLRNPQLDPRAKARGSRRRARRAPTSSSATSCCWSPRRGARTRSRRCSASSRTRGAASRASSTSS